MLRGQVVCRREGDHLVETQLVERGRQDRVRGLAGVALTQADRARRQPISVQGVNAASQPGTASPTKPMNSLLALTWTAHRPWPLLRTCSAQRSIRTSDSSLVSTAGKWAITKGSALSAANGLRSVSSHCRRTSRDVEGSKDIETIGHKIPSEAGWGVDTERMTEETARPVCATCGLSADDQVVARLTWALGVENGRQVWTCARCSREHLRSIESKLDSGWWW